MKSIIGPGTGLEGDIVVDNIGASSQDSLATAVLIIEVLLLLHIRVADQVGAGSTNAPKQIEAGDEEDHALLALGLILERHLHGVLHLVMHLSSSLLLLFESK